MGVAAGIAGAAASVVGAGTSLLGSKAASSASNNAAQLQAQQQTQTRADLSPFTQAGAAELPLQTQLANAGPTGGGVNWADYAFFHEMPTVPQPMTEQNLLATPGYQFNLKTGMQAVQNSAAARGLGVSGAALRGAATYATGLADSTYQNQFNNAQQLFQNQQTRFQNIAGTLNTAQQNQLSNQYSRVSGLTSLGENAGAQTGTIGANLAQSQGQFTALSGQQTGAGIAGVGNAITGGVNSGIQANLLNNAINNNQGSVAFNAAQGSGPLNPNTIANQVGLPPGTGFG